MVKDGVKALHCRGEAKAPFCRVNLQRKVSEEGRDEGLFTSRSKPFCKFRAASSATFLRHRSARFGHMRLRMTHEAASPTHMVNLTKTHLSGPSRGADPALESI